MTESEAKTNPQSMDEPEGTGPEAPESPGAGGPQALDPARAAADQAPAADASQTSATEDGPVASGDAAEAAQSSVAEMEALRQDFEALNDRHLRLAAEFNNYRRRVEQERAELWGRAQADLVGRFLDVLDDLHRVAGLDLGNATVEAIMEGIDLVERKFMRALADAGVEVLDPEGDPFDPATMEAMMRVPAEREDDDDVVAQVFQKGYALKGHLVRPARVSVLKLG